MQKKENRTVIPAFNDAEIISGQGTIGLEILEDLEDVDEVYVPVGGGRINIRNCDSYKII